eukprot:2337151-Rhodomonas_salina.1
MCRLKAASAESVLDIAHPARRETGADALGQYRKRRRELAICTWEMLYGSESSLFSSRDNSLKSATGSYWTSRSKRVGQQGFGSTEKRFRAKLSSVRFDRRGDICQYLGYDERLHFVLGTGEVELSRFGRLVAAYPTSNLSVYRGPGSTVRSGSVPGETCLVLDCCTALCQHLYWGFRRLIGHVTFERDVLLRKFDRLDVEPEHLQYHTETQYRFPSIPNLRSHSRRYRNALGSSRPPPQQINNNPKPQKIHSKRKKTHLETLHAAHFQREMGQLGVLADVEFSHLPQAADLGGQIGDIVSSDRKAFQLT